MTGNAAAWVPPEWARDFCKDYTLFLFSAGKWTIIAGIVLGAALALATILLLLRKPAGATEELPGAAAVGPGAILEAAKAFLQALSSAPPWLALFGAGILLLWLAGNTAPEACKAPPPPPCPQQCPPPVRSPTVTSPAAPAAPGNSQ